MKTTQEKLINQNNFIMDKIINGNYSDKFCLINAEPGSGKSLVTSQALVEMHKLYPNRKSLVVTRFSMVDKNEALSAIKINSLAGEKIAIAVDKHNYKKYKYTLKNYPIVLITHERYKSLSRASRDRACIIYGRDTLIVDEELDIIKKLSYSVIRIERFLDKLSGKKMKEAYRIITQPLLDIMNDKGRVDQILNLQVTSDIEQNIKLIRKLIKSLDKKYIGSLVNDYTKSSMRGESFRTMTKSDFFDEVSIIENFYKNQCYVLGKTLYTFNGEIKYWLLSRNNILLDANGSINHCYALANKLFICTNQNKIFNHSKWKVDTCEMSSNKGKKTTYGNYYEEIDTFVQELVKRKRKTLIIGNKIDEENLLAEGSEYEHFGNIIGRNDFSTFDTVFISHTPNLKKEDYVLRYMYFSRDLYSIKNSEKLIDTGYKRELGNTRFKNKSLHKIQLGYITGEIYQAVKRVDRNVTRETEVYIVNNFEAVIRVLRRQLKGAIFGKFSLNIRKLEKKVKSKTLQEDSYAQTLVNVLSKLQPGEYTKQFVRDEAGINGKQMMSKLLNHNAVIQFMSINCIKPHPTNTRKIIVENRSISSECTSIYDLKVV